MVRLKSMNATTWNTMLHTAISVILISIVASRIYRPSSLSAISFSQPGDWNIGVVIPVHEFSETSMCSRIPRRLTNLKKIEAIKFAVDEINERKDILPNTTLGFYIVDDCSKDTTAMTRALHFTQTLKVIKEHPDELRSYDVIGVIGAESSRNSVQIADLLSLFEIPVISYVSTSPLLSDKNKYPFFSRIVPSDSLQVSVLMDIIIKFNWNYVSIVYEDGSYGNEMYKAFKNLMNKNKKCLAVSRVVRGELTQEKAEQIINALKSADGARAVVLVLITSDAVKIFKTVKRLGYSNYFTWLGTDGWGSNINDYKEIEDVTVGSLTIGFHGVFVDRLDNYIKHLTPANATYNPWFNEFFERNYDCRFETNGSGTKCDRRKNLSEGYGQSFMPGFVMDAVYAYAYSLDTALRNCRDADIKDCIKGKRFLNIIRNTSFKGDNGIVAFDEFGDGESTYAIRSLREVNGGYELTEIGRWDTGIRSFTYFNTQNITWMSGFSNSAHPPISQCSKDCPPGFEAILTKPQCCWYCKRCHNNERSVMIDQKLTCEVCPVFSWPDGSKTGCAPITVSKISYDNATGISIMIVVIIMVSGTITCIVLYNKQINSHNSRNRELDYLIASGILASNIVPVAFLITPSESSCHFIQFGFQLSFTLVYSPFLLKAYTIFHADKTISVLGEEIPETPVRNVIYYGLVISIGMIIVILCAVTYPVRWETTMPDLNEAYVESTCQIEENGILIPAAYNVFVLLIATMLIIRSRNVRPSICSANECKFNNICGYTSIVLWLGFSVSYFTTSKSVILSVIICISMFGNASVFLCLLILPKLHDVYFPTMDHNRREDRQATALTCK